MARRRLTAAAFLAWLACSAANGAEPSYRFDLAGDALPPGATARLGTLRFRHTSPCQGVALSPDYRWAVTACPDGLYQWDLGSGRLLRRLTNPVGQGGDLVALSPDGRRVASIDLYATVLDLWEVRPGGRQQSALFDKGGKALALTFLPDGRLLVAADRDRVLHVAEFGERVKTYRVRGPAGVRHWWAFSAAGYALLEDEYGLVVWDWRTNESVKRLPATPNCDLAYAAFSPDGRALAWQRGDAPLRVWDFADRQERFAWRLGGRGLQSVRFGDDGRTLLVACDDGVHVLSAATGKSRQHIPEPNTSALAQAPDGTLVLGIGRSLRVWKQGAEVPRFAGHADAVSRFAFAPDGATLLSMSADCEVHLWDCRTGRCLSNATSADPALVVVGFQTQGRKGVVESRGQTGPRWEWKTAEAVGRHIAQQVFTYIDYAPGGGVAAGIAARLNAVAVVDLDTGKERVRHALGKKEALVRLTFSADGGTVACAIRAANGTRFRAWDTQTGAERLDVTGPEGNGTLEMALSPDGQRLAVWRADGTVSMWRAGARASCKLSDRNRNVTALAFSPDGRTLAAATADGMIRLLEAATGEERRHWKAPAQATALGFSPDGKSLASAHDDTTILLWEVYPPAGQGTLAEHWKRLRGGEGPARFASLVALAESGKEAVALIGEQVRPARPIPPERFAALLKGLDADDFKTREAARRQLSEYAELAEAPLRAALQGKPTPEVRRAVEELLEKLAPREPSADELPALRALEVLERVGTPEAKAVLEKLARGAEASWLTREAKASLARLAARK
jgi:WD40 repeat protein